jgi:hypothetical protein
LAGITPGTPPKSIPRPFNGFSRYRHQQRQAAVNSLHGFVRQANGSGFDHGVRQRFVRGKVEIGENQLVIFDQPILLLNGFFYFHNHFGNPENVRCRRENFGACTNVFGIRKTAAITCFGLNIHGVPFADQLLGTGRGEGHPVFVIFYFLRNANDHDD